MIPVGLTTYTRVLLMFKTKKQITKMTNLGRKWQKGIRRRDICLYDMKCKVLSQQIEYLIIRGTKLAKKMV